MSCKITKLPQKKFKNAKEYDLIF